MLSKLACLIAKPTLQRKKLQRKYFRSSTELNTWERLGLPSDYSCFKWSPVYCPSLGRERPQMNLQNSFEGLLYSSPHFRNQEKAPFENCLVLIGVKVVVKAKPCIISLHSCSIILETPERLKIIKSAVTSVKFFFFPRKKWKNGVKAVSVCSFSFQNGNIFIVLLFPLWT